MVFGAPNRDNNGGAVYVFKLQGKTWTEDKILTASYGASNDYFGCRFYISRDTLKVRAYVKNVWGGSTYVFLLASYR